MAGVIINHDQALRQREDFNLLYEPIEMMVKNLVEAWEANDPLEPLFVKDSIDRLQKTYSSSIGYDQVMSESANYAVGNLSNAQSGFRKTVSTRPFRGSKIIAQEVIDDTPEDIGKELSKWTKAWMRNRVQYALKSLDAGFGNTVKWGDAQFGAQSPMQLKSADTTDGVVETQTTMPLFIKTHTIVKRDFEDLAPRQSNKYVAPDILIGSNDPGQLSKLADVINWVKGEMDLWVDDNGQRVDYSGEKAFVTGYDSRIETAMNICLKEAYINGATGMGANSASQNPAYNSGVHKFHSMYNDTDALRPVYGTIAADGTVTPNRNINDRSGQLLGFGMFIVNKSYMTENNGLTFLERMPLTIKGVSLGQNDMEPEGVGYKGYCRFDIVNCTWRGIAYLWVGLVEAIPDSLKLIDADAIAYGVANVGTSNADSVANIKSGAGSFTLVTPTSTIVKPVSIIGTVDVDDKDYIPVNSITKHADIEVTVAAGTSHTASAAATILPANATNKDVFYVSSDTSKATVNPTTGLVTGVEVTDTDITITAYSADNAAKTATTKVKVVAGE